MTDITLTLKSLTPEAFAPYGDVIEVNDKNEIIPINYGMTNRHHALAKVDVSEGDGYPIVSIFNSKPVTLPFSVKVMERHPMGSQAFINMDNNPYVVVVGEAGEFDINRLQAFLAQANQGVNYHKGTWHHYSLCLNEANNFVVIDRGGLGDNCDEVQIPDNSSLVIIR